MYQSVPICILRHEIFLLFTGDRKRIRNEYQSLGHFCFKRTDRVVICNVITENKIKTTYKIVHFRFFISQIFQNYLLIKAFIKYMLNATSDKFKNSL